MAYPVGKPAHNRLTFESLHEECRNKGHVLLALEHPILRVRCKCGHEYEQKIHSYRAAKNSCKKCDSARKSRPRPEHSQFMTTNNPFKGKRHTQEVCETIRQLRLKSGSWRYSPEEREKDGFLYLVRYLDETGNHFKLGITKKTIKDRLGPKLISIIYAYKGKLGKCFDLEQAALRYASQHGYRYASPTTTELIRPEGMVSILEFIEQSLDDDEHLAEFTIS